jgi:hypothetical protein
MNRLAAKLLLPLLAALTLLGCASGSTIVTGTPRAPIAPERVKFYLDPPERFEVIGLVSASSDAGWTEQGSVDYAIQELKKQAAKVGANGVLLVSTGDKTSTVIGGVGTPFVYAVPVTAKTVQGRAILVHER